MTDRKLIAAGDEWIENGNKLADRLNAELEDQTDGTALWALCVALRRVIITRPEPEDRSRAAALCLTTIEAIPGLDLKAIARMRKSGLIYRDTRNLS
jgi:hypothetical protein